MASAGRKQKWAFMGVSQITWYDVQLPGTWKQGSTALSSCPTFDAPPRQVRYLFQVDWRRIIFRKSLGNAIGFNGWKIQDVPSTFRYSMVEYRYQRILVHSSELSTLRYECQGSCFASVVSKQGQPKPAFMHGKLANCNHKQVRGEWQ